MTAALTKTKYDFETTTADLEIGDVIQIPTMKDAPWGTGIVKRATPEEVEVFRPYGTSADFTCCSGVICYTGTENFTMRRSDEKVHVYQRPVLR